MRISLFLVLVLSLTACDTDLTPQETDLATSAFTSAPGSYTVPDAVDPLIAEAAQAYATERACDGAKPIQLPAGSSVQIVGEGESSVLRVRYPDALRAQNLSAEALGSLGNVRPSESAGPDIVLDCECPGRGGCMEALNPNSGHVYCDRFDECTNCNMKIKV